MFNSYPTYPYTVQTPAYQRNAYAQSIQTAYQPMTQPVMMQDGNIQARFVTGREEAVASNVMPGSMFLFHDRAHGMIYSKLIDPQTGMPDFRVYAEVQQQEVVPQQTPQYATVDALNAMRGEFEQMIDQKIAALQPPKATSRKAVNTDE